MPNKDGTGPDGQNRKFMKRMQRNQNGCGENQSRNFRNRKNSSFRNQISASNFDVQINELKDRIKSLERIFHSNK